MEEGGMRKRERGGGMGVWGIRALPVYGWLGRGSGSLLLQLHLARDLRLGKPCQKMGRGGVEVNAMPMHLSAYDWRVSPLSFAWVDSS